MKPLSELRWRMWAGSGGLGFLAFLTLIATGALRFPVDSGIRSSDPMCNIDWECK